MNDRRALACLWLRLCREPTENKGVFLSLLLNWVHLVSLFTQQNSQERNLLRFMQSHNTRSDRKIIFRQVSSHSSSQQRRRPFTQNHMLRSTTSVILNLFTENFPSVRVGARVWHHWTKVHFIPSDNSDTTNNRDVVKDQSSLSQEHCDHPVMMTKGENTEIYKCLNTDIDILS